MVAVHKGLAKLDKLMKWPLQNAWPKLILLLKKQPSQLYEHWAMESALAKFGLNPPVRSCHLEERFDIDIDYIGIWNEEPWGLAPRADCDRETGTFCRRQIS